MKTLYLVQDDENEIEGFFHPNRELIHGWCLNDANWSSEYMNPLINKLGYTVLRSSSPDLVGKLRQHFGL